MVCSHNSRALCQLGLTQTKHVSYCVLWFVMCNECVLVSMASVVFWQCLSPPVAVLCSAETSAVYMKCDFFILFLKVCLTMSMDSI